MADKKCGCSGIRSCLLCEDYKTVNPSAYETDVKEQAWTYCTLCEEAWSKFDVSYGIEGCHLHGGTHFEFNGITVIRNFITLSEESSIVKEIDESSWKPSQSGRRKQDFGPKVNFKKQKLKVGTFTGLPSFSERVVARMARLDCLKNFEPVEQCHLEYEPTRGSAIDAHFDDWWLWGEHLVTLNLLSDSFIVFHHHRHAQEMEDNSRLPRVRVLMPRRSLLVVEGDARFKWKHSIPRDAITSRRIAVTYRELSEEFREGGKHGELGEEVMAIARTFQGQVVE